MTDAIRAMIKKGIEDRQKIYDQLIVLDVLPKSDDKIMSSATVWRYIQAERKELGWKRNTKTKQILDAFDSGVSKKEMQAKYPGPKNRGQRNYIHDCLIKYGRIKPNA